MTSDLTLVTRTALKRYADRQRAFMFTDRLGGVWHLRYHSDWAHPFRAQLSGRKEWAHFDTLKALRHHLENAS